ncbi:DNA-processing protein DprA [Arcanobacterium canis]
MKIDDEHKAAIDWTRIAEGPDPIAVGLVERMGYAGGLAAVEHGQGLTPQEQKIRPRWLARMWTLRPFEYDCLDKLHTAVVIPSDFEWPSQCDSLGDNRPLALWIRGNSEVLGDPALSIVGSRDCSSYGGRIAGDIAFTFASRGIAIISGGAFGIDACAHRGALAAGGHTVIVSAAGVDRAYPVSHNSLFEEIYRVGAVVSESPIGCAPYKFRFLARNRIIAALGLATVVVEAPFRSGALSTARHAMEIGREVAAFPGPIDAPTSVGCHELIRHGANLVTSAEHIAELIEPVGSSPLAAESFFIPHNDDLDPLTRRLIDTLPKRGGTQIADIARCAGVSLPEALDGMARLRAQGKVRYSEGRWALCHSQ